MQSRSDQAVVTINWYEILQISCTIAENSVWQLKATTPLIHDLFSTGKAASAYFSGLVKRLKIQ